MSPHRLLSALALVGGVAACSGGPGTPAPIPTGAREPPGSPYEPPGSSNEPPGSPYESPNGSSGGSSSGGGSGSSSSGGGGSCPVCTTYQCTVLGDAGAGFAFALTLVSAGNGCAIQGAPGSSVSCDGTFSVPASQTSSASSGTWQPNGTGGIIFGGTLECNPPNNQGGAIPPVVGPLPDGG